MAYMFKINADPDFPTRLYVVGYGDDVLASFDSEEDAREALESGKVKNMYPTLLDLSDDDLRIYEIVISVRDVDK